MELLKKLAIILVACSLSPAVLAQDWMKSTERSTKPNFYQIQADFENHWKARKMEKGKGYKQFKRWEWYWEQRTSPAGEFPEQGADFKAWQDYESSHQKNKNKQTLATTANWSVMGPTSSLGGYEGVGRLNSIAFHPTDANTYFVASPGGGVWKTTTNGTAWTCLTDNLPAVGVSGIAVDYNTPNTMYISTGDGYGNFDTKSIGVLKTTNGGTTWNTTGLSWTTSQQRVIGAMIIHPTNPQILFAATSIGIYRTTDGGATWSQLTTFHTQDIKFKPTDPTVMYATSHGGTSANIYRSADSGATWTKITNFTTFNRINLAVTAANVNLVGAVCSRASDQGFGGFYTSTNSGTSFAVKFTGKNLLGWSAAGTDTGGQGWYDLSVAIAPNNANLMFIGGVNTWKSTDGGTTWNLNTAWTGGTTYNPNNVAVVHADKHFHAFHPLNASTLFECNDGGLYRTTNAGTNWTDLTNGLGITMFYRLSNAQTEANTLLAGAQDNGTKRRSSTGAWSMATGGDGMEAIVDFTNPSYMYASYANGTIYRSTNGFTTQSYTTISANLPGGQQTGAWVTPYVMDPSNALTLYAGYKDVYKTTNRGTSWTKVSTNLSTTNLISLAVAPSAPNTIYAASYTNMYATTNGTTWTNISAGLPFASAKMTYIAVHPTNSQIVFVTFSGYSSGNKVFKSTNGGTSWTNISGSLPNIPANCITLNKNGNEALYVGMDAGVFYRDATMSDWVQFNQGLPNTQVMELEIQYSTNKLRAATYGRGVWQSDVYSNTTQPALPTITSFSPTSGAVGTAVTITGTNFTGATTVRFNGTNATFTVVSATSITTTVPSGATTGVVTVITPAGTANSSTNFTVTTTAPALPTITSFSPTSGAVGTAVTITGTNFTGATAVRFNGTAATFTVASATSITTSVPSGATTGVVTVVTPAGTANSSTNFTVTTTTVTYCASNATNSADTRINNVTFAGINNSSTTACATYTNFTTLSANVLKGQSYSLSVTLGTCGGNYAKFGKVFVDWNRDGDFLDAGELVATSASIAGTAAFTATVTVPTAAITGSTRMRVVCVETSSAANVNSCGTYTYGETEDYNVNISVASLADKDNNDLISRTNGTGLDNIDALVYPNPTQDILNIELTNINAGAKLVIVNTLGAIVWQGEVQNEKVSVNTSNFSNGVYVLQVISEQGNFMKKFVKQ